MKVNLTDKRIKENGTINSLIHYFSTNSKILNLDNACIYCDFPVYKDLDEEIIIAQFLLVSNYHGIVLFRISEDVKNDEFERQLDNYSKELDNLYSIIYSRLLRNKELKNDRTSLKFKISSIIFSPLLKAKFSSTITVDSLIFTNYKQIEDYLKGNNVELINEITYSELIATIEGSKGIIITKARENVKVNSKGQAVNELEKEIARFDEFQKIAFSGMVNGVSRIRGLAGSGKTVVLCLKAAITHLRNPNSKIAYTFYTKSLHQHIKRLITRFYRQFDDKDPNWDNLEIIHAWGSSYNHGVYYNACSANNIQVLSYSEASLISKSAFSSACDDFLGKCNDPIKSYDFIFIDEGQDFPTSFLKLCIQIAKNNRVVWAYDDLQTIFQAKAPTPIEIFGADEKGNPKIDLDEDIVLYKCYRNPLEIIVVAHAIGFGIYGKRIRQMIDSEDYWKDIGYKIESGKLNAGEFLKIIRPQENSLTSISKKYKSDELIKANHFASFSAETQYVSKAIYEDIQQGLVPEDILVITVDDKNASKYLNEIQNVLASKYKILSNNIHSDKFAIKDFQENGRVTLSTIHKAKGNEAYSVYVVGIDSLFSLDPSIRERNILFTAMTRAKGWVCLSGIGLTAEICCKEIEVAISKLPYLEFKYPSEKDIKIMKRDMKEKAIRRSKNQKMLDELLSEMSPEEIELYIKQKSIKK